MAKGEQTPVTELLLRWQAGDAEAEAMLTSMIYAELHRLATLVWRDESPRQPSLNPTALIHEAYLRMVGQAMPPWRDRGHFFAIAGKLMRQVLVDRARQRKAQKRGKGRSPQSWREDLAVASPAEPDWLALDANLKQLARKSPRKAQILELRVFAGLTIEETADCLGLSTATVINDYRFAKGWLTRALSRDGGHG